MYCGWTRCMMWFQSCYIYWDLFCSLPVMYPRECSLCTWEESILFPKSPVQVCSNGVFYAHLLLWELQNYNSLLNNYWQENVGSHQKKIPHVQGQRRSPSKMVEGAILHLESNPISTREAQRVQTNLVWTRTKRPHRDWARTMFECLLQRYRWAVGCWRGRGSGYTRPGYGISPLGGGCH